MKVLLFCYCSGARSPLPVFLIFLVTLCVHKTDSARFTVIGSHDPVIAILGKEIVLPCLLSPRMSAANMEVRWFRSEFLSFVHLYREGKDQYEGQMPEYHGRTDLSKVGLTDGNVALRILNVRPSDEGRYLCFVQDDRVSEETVLDLRVGGLGSDPLISVEGHQDGGILVVCRSAGWYPEPEVLWKDLNRQHLSPIFETKSQGKNNQFKIETAIVVKEESNQNLSCYIRNTILNQEKVSAIYIADPFFPKVNPGMVALSVILVFFIVSFIGLLVYLFRMKGKYTEEIDKRGQEIRKRDIEIGWRRHLAPIEEVTVTLDPHTAHPRLVVSEDAKSVRQAKKWQDLPSNPERFDTELWVLGREALTSGRLCWEVKVESGEYWAVGLTRESVRRKGVISPCPKEGIWALWQSADEFWALTDPRTPLARSRIPSRIRVCLDCDRGQVIFFDAGDEVPIFTFPPGSVSGERLHPWLCVGDTKTTLQLCP